MDITTILTIIGILVAIVIGVWQIQLARKQIHLSKSQTRDLTKSQSPVNEQNAVAQDPKIDEYEYRNHPYPSEIFNITNQLPLIQRHEARNKYAGLKVKWRGIIQNLYLDKRDLVSLTVRVDDHNTFTSVYCKVKISDFPEVKIAKDGHGLWIYGEIKSVGNIDVELINCKIKLD